MAKDIDVTLDDLTWAARGTLRSVMEQINQKWVTRNKPNRRFTRCGTATVSNDNEGNGRIVIDLRFPLDLKDLED